MPRRRESEGPDRAVGTRSHPDVRGAVPVYQQAISSPARTGTAGFSTARRSRPRCADAARDHGRMARDRAFAAAADRRGAGRATVLALVAARAAAVAPAAAAPTAPRRVDLADRGWEWPVAAFRLERPYEAPAHRYGAGHRGIDLRPLDERRRARARRRRRRVLGHGGRSRHPHDRPWRRTGHDARAGRVAARRGRRRSRSGDVVGDARARRPHGVRRRCTSACGCDGEYINPLLLLGGVPRAVLLPCC